MSRRKATLLIIGLLVVLVFGFSTVPANGWPRQWVVLKDLLNIHGRRFEQH